MILSDTHAQRFTEANSSSRPPSEPIFYTSPIHLRAAAHLYGVDTVPVEKARVLELGCSAGGNLLPFALAHPGAHVVGIDLWSEEIQQGRKTIEALGIKNLDLRAMLFTEIDNNFGEFDYIIVHNIFTWASPVLRDVILRICRENLSPLGIACISCNVYPGWKTGDTIRDAMQLHGHSAASVDEALSSASAMLTLMSHGLADKNISNESIKSAVEHIRRHPDHYINKDFLQTNAVSFYLLEFADMALRADLAYVGDAEPQDELSVSYGLNVQMNHSLFAMGQPKVLRQQYLDFAVGREFRKSLFIRQERATEIFVSPDLSRFVDFHWASAFRKTAPEPGLPQGCINYTNQNGERAIIDDPLSGQILDVLSDVWPASLSFTSFVMNTGDIVADMGDDQVHPQAVQRALEKLFAQGVLRYCRDASPYDTVSHNSLCLIPGLEYLPLSDNVGKCDVARFNLWHDRITSDLTEIEKNLLPAFNGKNGFSQLSALLNQAIQTSADLEYGETKYINSKMRHAQAEQWLMGLVDRLRRQGILMGSSEAWLAYCKAALKANSTSEQALNGLQYVGSLMLHAASSMQEASKSQKSESGGKKSVSHRQQGSFLNVGPSVETIRQILNLIDCLQYQDAESQAQRLTVKFPGHPFGWQALGIALYSSGRVEEAFSPLLMALALRPSESTHYVDLGMALQRYGMTHEAELNDCRALRLDKANESAWNHLGNLCKVQRKLRQAEICYRRAIALKPDHAHAYNNLGNICADQLRMGEALICYKKAIDIQPGFFEAHSNFLFVLTHNGSTDPAELFKAHRSFGLTVKKAIGSSTRTYSGTRDAGRCLRVGFVSADLYNHAVASFLEPVWRSLDKQAFAIYAYSNTVREDEVSKNLQTHTQQWKRVVGTNDALLADIIRRDGIDILFDLSGHTAQNRLPMFALKPAPIQISWVGYPGTTGLKEMDYYILSKYVADYGVLDSQFTEKLVYTPTVVAFEPVPNSPDVNVLPSLSINTFTFASFNRSNKLSEDVFALWARVLQRVPDSRLLLGHILGPEIVENIKNRFAKQGINAERLIFRERTSLLDYLRLHHEVDLLLDTFPYTGGTTTNHGLWMGVPTLTLAGVTMAGRQGVILMRQYGLNEFVAQSLDDYVLKAVDWSNKRSELADIRSSMRTRIASKSSGSHGNMAQSLEAAMRKMWRVWCDGAKVESFQIEI